MAPVHDFRHVEIDNIGRGKRVLKPPGGECSDIFNVSPPTSLDHTPRRQRSYLQSTIFSPTDSVDGGTPTSSKKGHDTQNRLFGPPDGGATPKVVVDRQKSNIFSPSEDGGRTGSGKKQARRNPITGEVDGGSNCTTPTTPYTNGHAIGEAGVNGDATPVRSSRVPPGGRCSGIF